VAEEKPFPPTPHKLREARRKGDVARSAELTSTGTFALVAGLAWALAPLAFQLLAGLWRQATDFRQIETDDMALLGILARGQWLTGLTVAIFGLLLLLAALLGAYAQVGALVAWTRLKPQAGHLNPGKGLERVLSLRSVAELAKTVLKAVLVGTLMVVFVKLELPTLARIGYAPPDGILMVAATALARLVAWAVVIYAAMAAVDVAHQRFEYLKRNRMTHEELRREFREHEGNPEQRARRRHVQQADVVFTLQDRVAYSAVLLCSQRVVVGLSYPSPDQAPQCLVRTSGSMKQRACELARAAGRPLLDEPALAEWLYERLREGTPTPQDLHELLRRAVQRGVAP